MAYHGVQKRDAIENRVRGNSKKKRARGFPDVSRRFFPESGCFRETRFRAGRKTRC